MQLLNNKNNIVTTRQGNHGIIETLVGTGQGGLLMMSFLILFLLHESSVLSFKHR